MMPWFSNGPYFHGFGGMFMIFFWVMLLLICLALIMRKGRSHEKETAEEILKKRYARGEISQEEFLRMKKEIRE